MAFIDSRYGGTDFFRDQEQQYRHYQELQRAQLGMQQTMYNPYTQMQQGIPDYEREQQAVKPKTPAFLDNKKLLLLEN